MPLTDADETVLAFLRKRGPGLITIDAIADGTGLRRITARTSLYALHNYDRICLSQNAHDWGTSTRFIIHRIMEAPDGPVPG